MHKILIKHIHKDIKKYYENFNLKSIILGPEIFVAAFLLFFRYFNLIIMLYMSSFWIFQQRWFNIIIFYNTDEERSFNFTFLKTTLTFWERLSQKWLPW